MPQHNDFPTGALAMLILRVLRSQNLHGYAIAQRIRHLSDDVLEVEEGSLYPALQRMLLKGWVEAEWGASETGRRVRFYRLTASGRKQLDDRIAQHDLVMKAVQAVLETA
jgi:transcriptional regulator